MPVELTACNRTPCGYRIMIYKVKGENIEMAVRTIKSKVKEAVEYFAERLEADDVKVSKSSYSAHTQKAPPAKTATLTS